MHAIEVIELVEKWADDNASVPIEELKDAAISFTDDEISHGAAAFGSRAYAAARAAIAGNTDLVTKYLSGYRKINPTRTSEEYHT